VERDASEKEQRTFLSTTQQSLDIESIFDGEDLAKQARNFVHGLLLALFALAFPETCAPPRLQHLPLPTEEATKSAQPPLAWLNCH